MLPFFRDLFDTSGFPPRWHCGQWSDAHGWLHILSDIAIFGAYAAIPLVLAYFIRRRKDVPFIPIFWLFAAFIFSCGFTHLIEATLFWHPWYRLSGLMKAVTAVVSWITVIALIKVIPSALALPGLEKVNRRLNEEIAERQQAEDALRVSEERLKLAAEAGRVGIWDWNLANDTLVWDDGMFALYGARREDFSGAYAAWAALLHPEDRAASEAAVQDALAGRKDYPIQFRAIWPDGSVHHLEAHGRVFRDEAGQPVRMVGTNVDVTAQKNAERTIRGEAQRKDEFLAMLGHELRNPLNAIRHAVQIAHETPEDAEACQWADKVIDRQSEHLSRMVDDLLDVARIDRGRIELRPESLDLGEVLERALAVVRPLLEQRRHTLTKEIGAQLRVTGDAARLEQVFVNLLNNAAKYTPEGGSISVHARIEDGEVAVAITDNGEGISAELLPQVFDLFRQAETTLDRALGGLGIGLNVVKSLVEMHMGRVTMESGGAKAGTTVTVRLPLLTELHLSPRATASPARAAALPESTRVLVVDDHEDAAQALARLLRRRGCEVRCAHTGPDGVTAARDFHPEVLLLDLGLPGFDGYELARRLRADASFADALFIAISGYAQDGDRARCLAAGFDDHFAKPLDFTKLLEAIQSRCTVSR